MTINSTQLDSPALQSEKSGIVLFRTVNTNHYGKITGFNIFFESSDKKHGITSSQGINGYPSETCVALRFPIGRYNLKSFFVYGGVMLPFDAPYTFDIADGETVYIGTIVKQWTMPKHYPIKAVEVRHKNYYRGNMFNKKTDAVPLAVIDEGESVYGKFIEKFPALEGANIRTKLLE